MERFLIATMLAIGLYCLLAGYAKGVYKPAGKAVLARAPRKLTQTQILVNWLAHKMERFISMEAIQRTQLEDMLHNLNHLETPEAFKANAMAQAIVMAVMGVAIVIISIPIGLISTIIIYCAVYNREVKKLQKELEVRRQAIEMELPQFASTIRQNLNTTRDISAILSSYRKIAGPALAGEIDKTLNEALTGNIEKAIKSLEARVASPGLSQVTRGLQAVVRGDDQRAYFDVLAGEFRKAQDEAVNKMLLNRPKELNPYLGLLFTALVLMILSSVGVDLVKQMGALF